MSPSTKCQNRASISITRVLIRFGDHQTNMAEREAKTHRQNGEEDAARVCRGKICSLSLLNFFARLLPKEGASSCASYRLRKTLDLIGCGTSRSTWALELENYDSENGWDNLSAWLRLSLAKKHFATLTRWLSFHQSISMLRNAFRKRQRKDFLVAVSNIISTFWQVKWDKKSSSFFKSCIDT